MQIRLSLHFILHNFSFVLAAHRLAVSCIDWLGLFSHLALSPSRKAMDSNSTRTASSIGITGRASKTNAGSIEQNLWTAVGSSQSSIIYPPQSPTRMTNNSILKLAGAFHWVKTSRIRFWALWYSIGDHCGRSVQVSMYFLGVLLRRVGCV